MALAIESIVEGLELPVFTREGTLLHWVHYAAVNPAHIVGHHLDDEVGRREGFAAAFIMAPLEHAYLHAMLRQWMEGRGRVHRLDIRLRRPLLRGRWLTAGGDGDGGAPGRGPDVRADLRMGEGRPRGVTGAGPGGRQLSDCGHLTRTAPGVRPGSIGIAVRP